MSDGKLKAKDLRANSLEELQTQLRGLQQELFQSKLKQSTNQLENTMVVRKARRDIARINTIVNEKRRAAQAAPAGSSAAAPTSEG